MAAYMVKLPDVGEGVAEAEIVAWHVAVGDVIGEDATFVEVMTDKATVELPSPVSGRVSWLGAEVGDVLPVGSDLIGIETDAELVVGDAELVVGDTVEPDMISAEPAPPAPPPMTDKLPSPPPRQPSPSGPKATAAPAVRRRAEQLGIELSGVTGTGPGGRVEHGDLDRVLAANGSGHVSAGPTTQDAVEAIKVVGLRRNIAQRMQLAKRRIPHFTYVEELDVTAVERLRAELNDRRHDDRPKLTLLPFLMRAVVVAVGEFPQMNARFDDEAGVIERHASVHLGVAAQTDKGLMVPVVNNAQDRDIWECAAEVTRLSTAARNGTITMAELGGSTITITSLGSLGGIVSTPIINLPEVAIIGVNKIVQRPVLVAGSWVPTLMMNLSSSFDHRVIDGWDAALFIQRIKGLIESPAQLFMTP